MKPRHTNSNAASFPPLPRGRGQLGGCDASVPLRDAELRERSEGPPTPNTSRAHSRTQRKLTPLETKVRAGWRLKLNTLEIAQRIALPGQLIDESDVANALARLQDYAYCGEIEL